MTTAYPAEFRRRAVALVQAGQSVTRPGAIETEQWGPTPAQRMGTNRTANPPSGDRSDVESLMRPR